MALKHMGFGMIMNLMYSISPTLMLFAVLGLSVLIVLSAKRFIHQRFNGSAFLAQMRLAV